MSSDDSRTIRIGTRSSALAMAQARLAADALVRVGQAYELVPVETEGDRRAPDTAWGEGAFVKAIEQALLDDRVDLAVHSAKDVPTEEDPRLVVCAYLPREDPLDVLVLGRGPADNSETIEDLPAGARIGTDSPRRQGFLRHLRPDLDVRPLHGNVDTRLRRLDSGEVDGLVLAAAGLLRLGLGARISQRLPAAQLPPAPAQGAIALQVRANDTQLLDLGSRLDDGATRRAVEAERSFLRQSGGGCRAPIGALACATGERLELLGGYALPDGRLAVIDRIEGEARLADQLAGELANRLAAARLELLEGPRVLLTRQPEHNRRLANRLGELGIAGLSVPALATKPIVAAELDDALRAAAGQDWLVVTSASGARAVCAALRRVSVGLDSVRWAAVGPRTAEVLRASGVAETWLPSSPDGGEALGSELPVDRGSRVLLARGDLADERLPELLRQRGAAVTELTVYRTLESPEGSRSLLAAALADDRLRAVLFFSPSAVRGLLGLANAGQQAALLALPAVCIGSTTAHAAREAGFTLLGRSKSPDADSLAELTARLLGGQAAAVVR